MKDKLKIVKEGKVTQSVPEEEKPDGQISSSRTEYKSLEEQIDIVLGKMKMLTGLTGQKYLKGAIKLRVDHAEDKDEFTQIYGALAKQFHTEPNQIERAIRYAIQTGWPNGARQCYEELTGETVSTIPTNKRFIEMVSVCFSKFIRGKE